MGLVRVAPAVLVLGAWAAAAAEPSGTQELLQAPRVRRYVSVAQSADGKTLEYTLDDAQLEAPAKADTPLSVVANGNVAFLVAGYNPLTMKLSLADKLFDEPNLAALVKGLTPIVAALDKAAAEREQAALNIAGDLATINLSLASNKTASKAAGDQARCERFDATSLIARFNTELAAARLSEAKLAKWASAARGRAGIGDVGQQITSELAELAKHLPEATTAHATLVKWFDERTQERAAAVARLKQLSDGIVRDRKGVADIDAWLAEARRQGALAAKIKERQTERAGLETQRALAEREALQLLDSLCDEDDAFTTALLFVRDAPEVELERVKSLHAQLAELAKSLRRIGDDGQRWYDRVRGRDAGFVMGSRQTLEDKGRLVTVKIERLAPRIHDDIIEFEPTDTSASLQLRLRERSMFAFEVAPALVYSFLQEPRYKVAEADGRKTVARNGSEERKFKAALMLNGVCRCTGKSNVYPMLQFGVTPDDSLLAFFMGGGFRFLRPNGLSMSFGAVVTRSKDLDKLQVGSTVADQAAIDSDLKERSVIKPYFSVQFKF